MTQSTRTFRIFVSSTFSDLKEERNALHRYVYPRLRDLCTMHGCRFQAIDLRWGVSEEAGLDQQTMKICLGEIERCQKTSPRPNFIVLLGDRYGWRPLPYEIPADEFDRIEQQVKDEADKALLNQWYKRDDNAVPPVFCLLSRTGEYIDYRVWEEKAEKPLRAILRMTVESLHFSREELFKYIASATEQEIVRGALKVEDAHEHVFCFFRTIEGITEDACARDFYDYDEHLGHIDEDAQTRIKALKETLKKHLPGNCLEYKASWENNRPAKDYIGKLPKKLEDCLKLDLSDSPTTLCEDVWRRLSRVILDEAARIKETEPLTQEISLHDKFRVDKSRFFIGRENSLRTISVYLYGNSNKPFVVLGSSGSGKSAVMAKAIERAQKEYPDAALISRFIGATPASSDGRSLLESICRQIARNYNQDEKSIHTEYLDLVSDFKERLKSVPTDKPLIIFLDALDQLSNADNARNLAWLPFELPENVKLIISIIPGDCHEILKRRLPHESILELKPMQPGEGKALLKLWLDDVGRELQTDQEKAVTSRFNENGLPLYLKLAFEEVRRWRSFTEQEETELSPDIPGIIEKNLFVRLSKESNHGKVLVSKSLGYLAASRYGLSEDEILDVLSQDQEVLQDVKKRARQDLSEEKIPVVIWSRLYFDLEPYLTERNAAGAAVLSFYHRQLGEAAVKNYLDNEKKTVFHQQLAQYFGSRQLWIEKDKRNGPNLRQLVEVPYQQTQGGLWEELEVTLCDLRFMEAKSKAEMVYDLLRDFDRAKEKKELPFLNPVRRAVSLSLPVILDRPELTLQTLYNHMFWLESPTPVLKESMDRACNLLNAMPFWICARAPLPGHKSEEGMSINFGIKSVLQALSHDKKNMVIASSDGMIEIRELQYGESIVKRQLITKPLTTVALNGNLKTVVFMDNQGTICDETSNNTLLGRSGDKVIAVHPDHGVFAVTRDNRLVVWNSEDGSTTLIAEQIPYPLIELKLDPDGRGFLFVSGERTPLVGVALKTNNGWETKRIYYCGPIIVCADLDFEQGKVLIASIDRCIRLFNFFDGSLEKQIFYEMNREVVLRGVPEKCSLGTRDSEGWLFLATNTGQIAGIRYTDSKFVRLVDYGGISEAKSLVCFTVMPENGWLFFTTAGKGNLVKKEGKAEHVKKHTARVSSCLITPSDEIISCSEIDQTVRWYTTYGLALLDQQAHQAPVVVALSNEKPGEILIGNKQGAVYVQSLSEPIKIAKTIQYFSEPVCSLFRLAKNRVVAAGKSGRVLAIDLDSGNYNLLRHSTGFDDYVKIRPAGANGFWAMNFQVKAGDHFTVISHNVNGQKEEVVFSTRYSLKDFDVTSGGSVIAMAGPWVRINDYGVPGGKELFHRETPVNRLAFMDNGKYLAVALENLPWLEIWESAPGLPTIAAIELPGKVSCIAVDKLSIALGFVSGDMMSLKLNKNGD